MEKINIAIDGPSGAGKSTLAKMVAAELGFIYVDTGAMYRAIGLYMIRQGIKLGDSDGAVNELENLSVDIKYIDGVQRVFLNGEDVSNLIRTEEVSRYASFVSAIPEVRTFLLSLQRIFAAKNNVIMDGRDIGTVILPNAQVKIFLTASDSERAERRYKELIEKGQTVTYDSVLENIRQRDEKDSQRAVAPLKPAADAVLIDTTGISLEESEHRLRQIIQERMPNV